MFTPLGQGLACFIAERMFTEMNHLLKCLVNHDTSEAYPGSSQAASYHQAQGLGISREVDECRTQLCTLLRTASHQEP